VIADGTLYIGIWGTSDELGNRLPDGSLFEISLADGTRKELVSGFKSIKPLEVVGGRVYASYDSGSGDNGVLQLELSNNGVTKYKGYGAVVPVGDTCYFSTPTPADLLAGPCDGSTAPSVVSTGSGIWEVTWTSAGAVATERDEAANAYRVYSIGSTLQVIRELAGDAFFLTVTARGAVVESGNGKGVDATLPGGDPLHIWAPTSGFGGTCRESAGWCYSVEDVESTDSYLDFVRFPTGAGQAPELLVSKGCLENLPSSETCWTVGQDWVVWQPTRNSAELLIKTLPPRACQTDLACSQDGVVCGTDGYCVPG